MVLVMDTSLKRSQNIAASTFELRRAAGHFEQRASAADAVAALPLALADVEKALERLAAGAVKAAQAVEDSSGKDTLSPEARALRWHLFHLAARLRGAEDACLDARRSARELLAQRDLDNGGGQATYRVPVVAMQLRADGDAVAV
jgi:hypothetical protein